MLLVIVIDIVVLVALVVVATTKGFERTLPLATFLLILFPEGSEIALPGLFDLTTQRLVILTLLALYFAVAPKGSDAGSPRPVPLKTLILLQILWMAVATAHSVVFDVSLKTTLSQLLDYFVAFWIFAKGVRRPETVRSILVGFVSCMIVLSIFGVIEAYNGWNVQAIFPQVSSRLNIVESVSDRGDRIQTTFDHAILFGGALAMAIPAALYLISTAKSSRTKIYLWAGLMPMFLSIYKTGSRGPWLALLGSMGIMALFGSRRVRVLLMAIALLTVSTLIARPGIWISLRDMYAETRNPDSPMGESYQWRYVLYHIATQQLSRNTGRALWGYGPESFFYLGLTTQVRVEGDIHTVRVESCDSSIVATMIETGYVGIVITALLLLTPAWITWRTCRTLGKPFSDLPLVLLCNMLAFYFLMSNVAIYGWGQQSYMLWIAIALGTLEPALFRLGAAEPVRTAPASPWPQDRVLGSGWVCDPAVLDGYAATRWLPSPGESPKQ
jgi:hypothetical protein